ncbi:16S rRNA (uracil(1498)-N(3))-methyltransferase [Glaciibacter flavus]|uniref:Ribosomal RNA small subunit methyltransferase E n=1 Tax=Orlajensenia flava TaxID=2565934 RepID=A0A4S4FYR0_9MICO|nr:16S rRNA (uracil(1498)-N(3))-methyltransferase [Glaciibacter flavus]THG35175.1 16S rRNA (uracil(1498)-N(3))-methyltransferase [Glaciibacter flavus]
MSSLYLSEDLDVAEPGDEVEVLGAEARHAVTVGRARPGDVLAIGNGRGILVRGTVISADPSRLLLRAESVERAESPSPRFVLVQALAKGDRDELAVQAATELGVDVVIPWAARRSVSRWDAQKAVKGRDRWAMIAREATKQSIRPWLPVVEPVVTTRRLAELAAGSRMLLLEPTAEMPLTGLDLAGKPEDLVVVVGPEGGIAPEELELLVAAGATAVRLGSSVLRTSTAGPAALSVLNASLGRW